MSSARRFHRWASPWIFGLLLVSLVTGVAYRVGRNWFGMSKELGNQILHVHTGAWMGEGVAPYYVLAAGGGLLAQLLTGVTMLVKEHRGKGVRTVHWILALVLTIPLAATAVTGILFEWGESRLGFSEEMQRLLMSIHQGSWLGKELRLYYILFVGLGLLALGLSGLRIKGWFRR